MTLGRIGGTALAPVRLAAKEGRDLIRHARRTVKSFKRWPFWTAVTEQPRRLVQWAAHIDVPVHRLTNEASVCPACGSTALKLIDPIPLSRSIDRRGVGFATGCRTCGLLFVNPPPDPESLTAFYSSDGIWAKSHYRHIELLERQARRALGGFRKVSPARRSHDVLVDALRPYAPVSDPPAGAAVLDFGCGDGKLLNVLQYNGWSTWGLEPSTDVAFLRHRRLESLPQSAVFNLVLVHHVLEHVAAPLDLLERLAATLRPDGVLFISVPRLDTLPEHGDIRYCLNTRTHVVCFSETCLRGLLARVGLETVDVLTDPALDAQLTEGKPLRLRLVAKKTGHVPSQPSHPLTPALRALDDYYRRNSGLPRRLQRCLPVRTRAFWLTRVLRSRPHRRAPAA